MPIIQNIARKQGTINQHPNHKGVSNSVFGSRGNAGANVGSVTNPGNPDNLTLSGMDYNSQISNTGDNTNPVGTHSDTATQKYIPALVPNHLTDLVPISKAVDVRPNEKGKFFFKKQYKTAALRVSGGVDANSNTPFHPKQVPVTKQKLYPSRSGERTHAESFSSQHTLQNLAHPGGTYSVGARWSQVKRGAAEAPVEHHGTLATPDGIPVGSGTTGLVHSGNPSSVVNQNVHAGSPFVTVWQPTPRGNQPNEKGNTNPTYIPCRTGCK